jgi:hypothetical protein
MIEWDLLWTPARLALKAVQALKPGQLVSACPGLMSLTRKVSLGGWLLTLSTIPSFLNYHTYHYQYSHYQ